MGLTATSPSYRDRFFATQPRRKFLLRGWQCSLVVGAVTLCATRSIDRITVQRGDAYLLKLLGLPQLGDEKNLELGRRLKEMP